MTVYAITDTKKGRTGIAPTYLQTTPRTRDNKKYSDRCSASHCTYQNMIRSVHILAN